MAELHYRHHMRGQSEESIGCVGCNGDRSYAILVATRAGHSSSYRNSGSSTGRARRGSDAAEGRDGAGGDGLVGAAVTLGVLRLPVPEVAAHRLESLGRVEAKLLARDLGVCDQFWDVTTSTLPVS